MDGMDMGSPHTHLNQNAESNTNNPTPPPPPPCNAFTLTQNIEFNTDTTHSSHSGGDDSSSPTHPHNTHHHHPNYQLQHHVNNTQAAVHLMEQIEGPDSDVHSNIPPSPATATPISPKTPHHFHASLSSSQHLGASPHSPPSCSRKVSPPPQTTHRENHPSPHPRHTSPSPSTRSHTNDSPHKRLSTSPKRRLSSPERSLSRSPTRQRGPSYGSRREYRDRSRSRSPIARGRYRRSPRRYSPRRRSPSGYHSRRRSPRRRPWSPPHSRNNGVGRPGNNLFVAGFSFVTTERDLERKFSRFGRVRDVRIVRDKRSGDSRGFGFLSLERDEDADAAIRALDQTEWNGRVVLVEKSKSR